MRKYRYIIILLVVILMTSFAVSTNAQPIPTITIDKPIAEMTIPELQAKIAEILQAIQQLQALIAQLGSIPPSSGTSAVNAGIPSSYTFNTNLTYGSSSNEVKYLQIILNQDPDTRVSTTGFGSSGNESTYFGNKTKQAIIKFQAKYKIDISTIVGYTIKGTGYLGQGTRTMINQLLGQYRSGEVTSPPLDTPIIEIDDGTYCGDNIIQTPNFNGVHEVCDNTSLNNQTCSTRGYFSGALSCSNTCLVFDTSNCLSVTGGVGGTTPTTPTPPVVTQPVGPVCGDNTDNTCPSGCTNDQDTDCTYCGDNILQTPNDGGITEVCDNTSLNNQTCSTQGFPAGGTLQCSNTCLTFNTNSCNPPIPPNNAPVLNPIGSQSTNENQEISFNVSGTDTNLEDTLSYSVQDLPTGATFTNQTFTWTPTYTQSGTYNVIFTLSDSSLTDTETITITVGNVNRAPTLDTIGDKSTNENQTITFTISGTDLDDNSLNYSIQNRPTGSSFNASTRTFTWTPTYTQSGTHTITFIVSDTEYIDQETITITVADVVQSHTLTVSTTNGSVSRSPNQAVYTSGTVVTLTVIPNSGYTFSNWSGDLTGTSSLTTITMDSDKSVNANFSVVAGGQDTEAIAVWAYPDSNTVSGVINVGVVSYHSSGINRIDFDIDGGSVASVAQETINPDTNEYEYVFSVDTTSLTDDVSHTIHAIAYPNLGVSHTLPDLIIQVDNTPNYNNWYVQEGASGACVLGNPCGSIHTALVAADSGDTVFVGDGTYNLFNSATPGYGYNYGFTKYTVVKADTGANPVINPGISLIGSSFMKFENLTFNFISSNNLITSYTSNHIWFDGCKFNGIGGDVYPNQNWAFNSQQQGGANAGYIILENNEITDTFNGLRSINPDIGNFIIRNNYIHNTAADGLSINSDNVLITGNRMHDIDASDIEYHADFIDNSNGDRENWIIRNNEMYGNTATQGIKFACINPGDCYKKNIAIINNLINTHDVSATVAFRQDDANGQSYHFTNILVEHNTIWEAGPGGNGFFLNNDHVDSFTARNNIFGSVAVGDHSLYGYDIDYNRYNIAPATGGNSSVGAPPFVNAISPGVPDDFKLTEDFPGINSAGIFYDLNWNLRDANPDAGAYEYQGGSQQCAGTDTSCGTYPNCQNYNTQDTCLGTTYRDYYCVSNDQGSGYTEDDCSDCSCSCGGYNQTESIANNNCNDGIDNNCNGLIDSQESACQASAVCTSGQTQPCSTGLQGVCSIGTETCQPDNTWGSCIQDNQPIIEDCTDLLDNDCDGTTDCNDTDCFSNPICQVTEIPTDYISYWKFDGNANDETGSNNGTIVGNSQYVSGVQGQGLNFDGDGDYVDLTENAYAGYDSISVCLWFKSDILDQSIDREMIQNLSTGANSFYLSRGGNEYISFLVSNSEDTIGLSTAGTRLLDTNWHYACGTWDGTTVRIYVDVTNVDSSPATLSGVIKTGTGTTTTGIGLGALAARNFNGTIDEVMIYDRALTAQEIQDIYNAQKPGASPARRINQTDEKLNNLALIISNMQATIQEISEKIGLIFNF